ncbi:hypothetical protein [Halalkalicoccus ordinarius]|uniref:hypothetical protein n=1 Tax=Halalkalicoccus ordinarius TaxID=3116651 RepID=UPI00300F0DD1
MSRQSQETLRHVPSDECTRCGAQIDPDQGMFVLREETAVDEDDTVESGNLCVDCFEDVRAFVQGEA